MSRGESRESEELKMTGEDQNQIVFSVEQARRLLGISRGLAYEGVRTGQIPSVRIGRRILIPRAALKRKLDGGKESIGGSQ